MRTLSAVLFDFGQTLVDSADGFRTAEKQAETEIFADLGLRSWEEFLADYRQFRKAYHERSGFSRKTLWQAIYAHYGQEPDLAFLAQAERSYWRTVSARTRPFPETETVLEELAARHRLALITNTQGQGGAATHRITLFPRLERLFEVIIVAGEGGIPAKPSAEPFLRCLEALRIAPSEAIYVGDDWRIDIEGARSAGIRPIWLQHHTVTRRWPLVETSVPIITSLELLLDLVGQ